MKHVLQITSVAVFILFAVISEAGTMRATQLDQQSWQKFFAGNTPDVTIEFRQGDSIPVIFNAEGDFFETHNPQPSQLSIKKDFWMRVLKQTVEFSLDGTNFKPLPQVAKGNFIIGTQADDPSGGRANGINMILQAYQK